MHSHADGSLALASMRCFAYILLLIWIRNRFECFVFRILQMAEIDASHDADSETRAPFLGRKAVA